MRAVVQRVRSASVTVEGKIVSSIGPGLLCLIGVREGDTQKEAELMCERVLGSLGEDANCACGGGRRRCSSVSMPSAQSQEDPQDTVLASDRGGLKRLGGRRERKRVRVPRPRLRRAASPPQGCPALPRRAGGGQAVRGAPGAPVRSLFRESTVLASTPGVEKGAAADVLLSPPAEGA